MSDLVIVANCIKGANNAKVCDMLNSIKGANMTKVASSTLVGTKFFSFLFLPSFPLSFLIPMFVSISHSYAYAIAEWKDASAIRSPTAKERAKANSKRSTSRM